MVTYPNSEIDDANGWENYTKPSGKLEIPDTVYWNGTYYLVVAVDQFAFSKCREITSCTIPNTCKTLGKKCFYDCSNLESVTLGKMLTTIGESAFYNCYRLKQIILPDNVTELGSHCFYHCKKLQHVTLSSALTSIPNSCFNDCFLLRKIVLPNKIRTIGKKAFQQCRSIASIDVPSSVNSIGVDAFEKIPNVSYKGTASGSPWGAYCVNAYYDDSIYYNSSVKTAIVSVDRFVVHAHIPASVTSFGPFSLWGCNDMKTLKMETSQPPISQSALMADDVTIIVPCNAIEAYKEANFWKDFNITCEGGGNDTVPSDPDPDPEDSTHIANIIPTNITVSSQREGVLIGNANGENIDIFDVYGRAIYRKKIHDTELIPLQTGFYIVRINGMLCRKIIIMR